MNTTTAPHDLFAHIRVHDIVALCASPGMGKTTMLNRFLVDRAKGGFLTRYVDLEGHLPEESTKALEEALAWCQGNADGSHAVAIAFDNLVPGDESEVDAQVALIRLISQLPCVVALSLCPEDEYFMDLLGEANRFWSCDLRAPGSDDEEVWRDWTHGIPRLVSVAARSTVDNPSLLLSDPGYQEAYVSQVASNFRKGIILEERMLRLAMILLGSGTRPDLDEVLSRVDDEIWRLFSRDAPFFGVDVSAGSFSCVGHSTPEGLYVSFRMLLDEGRAWPSLVISCASLLARRGEFSRAALVGRLCPDAKAQSELGLAWCCEFVNAGEAEVVVDALDACEADDDVPAQARLEAACVLIAAGLDAKVKAPWKEAMRWASEHGGTAALALSCRLVMQGRQPLEIPSQGPQSPLADGLRLHVGIWSFLSQGSLDEAYSALLEDSQRLGPTTVAAGLLAMDYVLVSTLLGILPAQADMEAFERAGRFFERAELPLLMGAHDAVLPAAWALASRQHVEFSFEPHLHRANRLGYSLVRGLYLLVLAVLDLRAGVPKRAHVRLLQARTLFTEAEADGLVKITQLLYLATQYRMGERVTKPEIAACRGVSKSVDRAITVFGAALSREKRDRPVGSGRWGSMGCPRDVHWIVNVLSNDCGALSTRYREVMPPSWKDSVLRTVTEIESAIDGERPSLPAHGDGRGTGPAETGQEGPAEGAPIEVTLLGGFEVRVHGMPLQAARLERRRAKALFALLAAVPGHVAKRFTIMESIWPECDYGTAMHYVYAATSVIRGELCLALGVEDASVVLSDKSQGTIGLDEHSVSCDVDKFEEMARLVLDSQGDDHAVANLCREVEDLYKGDLFVPPTDGMGVVEARSREIRMLFADVMVAGAHAANNMGMRMLACRFARRAHDVDDLREDAVRALVESLCGAGRHVEAEACYEEFSSHVIDATRRPPSRLLREDVHDLLHGVARGNAEQTGAAKGELGGHVRIVESHGEDKSGQLKFLL